MAAATLIHEHNEMRLPKFRGSMKLHGAILSIIEKMVIINCSRTTSILPIQYHIFWHRIDILLRGPS
jgi:hypothetical protein